MKQGCWKWWRSFDVEFTGWASSEIKGRLQTWSDSNSFVTGEEVRKPPYARVINSVSLEKRLQYYVLIMANLFGGSTRSISCNASRCNWLMTERVQRMFHMYIHVMHIRARCNEAQKARRNLRNVAESPSELNSRIQCGLDHKKDVPYYTRENPRIIIHMLLMIRIASPFKDLHNTAANNPKPLGNSQCSGLHGSGPS